MGHSAGAVHAATYVANPKFHGPRGIGLAGAILVSGLYDFAKFPPGPPEKAYFGEEEAKRAEASTLALLPETRIRLMVVYGELDPAQFIEQSKLMGDALCKANRCSSLLRLPKHSHMSEVYAINTKDRVAERRDPRVREGREVGWVIPGMSRSSIRTQRNVHNCDHGVGSALPLDPNLRVRPASRAAWPSAPAAS